METIKGLVRQAQTEISTNLPQSYTQLQRTETGTEISIYRGGITPENATRQAKKMISAFPELSNTTIQLILERAKEKGFSDQRLTDAVNQVIDTCRYPNPKPADFLSFDKRVQILTYNELCEQVGKGVASFETQTRITINGNGYWVRTIDKELHNIPDAM